ncbi:MAG: hypothetical protein M0Q53_05855 [Prolixibacteraceae bacterium]|nr:hypothetical protein [Prolixibacteraceae bacterium]
MEPVGTESRNYNATAPETVTSVSGGTLSQLIRNSANLRPALLKAQKFRTSYTNGKRGNINTGIATD